MIINNENQEINKHLFKEVVINKKSNKLSKKKYIAKLIYLNVLSIYLILYIVYYKLKSITEEIRKKNKNNLKYIHENYNKYKSIVNKYQRAHINWPIPKEITFKPFMSDIDLKAFLYFMKPKNIYFEFGSGGTTNVASYYKLKAYSVESDVRWHEKLKNTGINANYITIDLNATYMGYPGLNTSVKDWKKYIQAYKKNYNADIILIDGRFRVACALDIFSKIRNDTLILIHDYIKRTEYYILERYYIKLKVWDTLALFIKNTNIKSVNRELYKLFLKEKKN